MDRIERIEKYLALIKKYPHIVDNSNELQIITDENVLYETQKELYSMADSSNQPQTWYDLGIIAEDLWVVIIRDLVKFPSGKYGGYVRTINRKSQLEQSGKDVVILIKIRTEFLLMKHFRHDDRMYHWECPRGFGEEGLSDMENALKEIKEETGLNVNSIEQLNNKTERVAYFIADCTGSVRNYDVSEPISDTMLVSKSEFESLIKHCEIDDMYTIRAFALANLGS